MTTKIKNDWKEVSTGMWERNNLNNEVKITPDVSRIYLHSIGERRMSILRRKDALQRFISFLRSNSR